MDVAIGIIIKPILLKKLMLIKIFKKTIKIEMYKGVLVLSLAKKKLDKIFIKAKAGTPYPKNFNASAVISTSVTEKDPYPNNALTISFDASINPKHAGIENSSESSKDLFCISEIFLIFFVLKAFERTGKETVPTAIPAIARLI